MIRGSALILAAIIVSSEGWALCQANANGAPREDEASCIDVDNGMNLLQVRASNEESRSRGGEGPARLAGFAPPFAYSILGPEGSLVARLILPLTESCPEDLVLCCAGKRGSQQRVPAVVRAEPAVGHGLFYVNGQTFNTMEGVNFSVSSPHPAFNFADRVCEARLEASVLAAATSSKFCGAHFQVGGKRLSVPLPPSDPTKIVVVGDTGLRIKSKNDGWCSVSMGSPKTLYHGKTCPEENLTSAYDPTKVSGMFQKAGDSIDPALNEWPFNKVAAAASREVHKAGGKAIVMHVGDFTYRHEPCPMPFPTDLTPEQQESHRVFGDCMGVGANWGDTSDGWAADFFEPAAPLLQAAPWIVLRGNHETCGRGGMGWFRYLDPRPADGDALPGATSDYPWCMTETPPYSVDFENDQFLVIDSNDVAGEAVGIDDFPQQAFTNEALANHSEHKEIRPLGVDCDSATSGEDNLWMFSGLSELVESGKRHWISVHRPVFALSYENLGGGTSRIYSFQCELANAAALAGVVVDDVPAIVSGHVHYFQLVQYQEGTAQIALGNGGTQLKTPLNGRPIGLGLAGGKGFTVLGDEVENVPTVGEWGYGVLATAGPGSTATLTAKFLSDAGFSGSKDVTATLPLRTFSVPGSGWVQAAS